ncbi:DNA-binding transcriptional ArsR family regulator [Salinibacterium sp. CAN_S4]|uniref:ArsR/SmtB family transcription factor n=1 Tax=Salinibacterium sp. CAN_S4 TaxID=2787727 RepID=UPI0018EF846C
MADIFDVIADATRRDLMQALLDQHLSATSGTGDISVSELVEKLGLSQPTVSKHLKVLRDHGLVSVREDGQHRYYSMDADPLETVEDWLIPFLSADFDDSANDGGSAAFAAWSGADVGDTLGRRIAEGSHQARTVIHDATDKLHDATEAVAEKLPDGVRRRLFRDR